MKILLISNTSATGGAPEAFFNLVCGLLDKGHEIAVVLPDRTGPLYSRLFEAGVKIYADVPYMLCIRPRVLNPVKYYKRMKVLKEGQTEARAYIGRALDEFKPDIVHTNVGPLDLALEECRKRGIPHVWHLREFQYRMKFYPSQKIFREEILSEGNHNIAITHCVGDYWNIRETDSVIYDAIPEPEHMPERLAEDFYLYVGRLEKQKGAMQLLRAFKTFNKMRPIYRLVLIGQSCGLYGLRCKLYAKTQKFGRNVQFIKYCEDLGSWYSRATALVVPAVREGFGLTTATAMLYRCPVIGRDCDGTREQFDNGKRFTGEEIGYRYKRRRKLVELMAECALDKNPAKMQDRAQKTVRELYTQQLCTDKIERLYNQVLGNDKDSGDNSDI